MTCNKCTLEFNHLRGAIIDGLYGQYCKPCISDIQKLAGTAAAQFARESDRREHEKDIIQPFDGDRPNPDFIRAYPNQAKEQFTEKELRQYG